MPDDSERSLKELLGNEVEELALQQIEEIPEVLPVLPVRGAVLFPGAIMPILVASESSLRLVRAVLEGDRLLVVTAVRSESTTDTGADDLYHHGTVARVLKALPLPNGKLNVITQGLSRARLRDLQEPEPYFSGRVELSPDDDEEQDVEIEALTVSVRRLLRRILKVAPGVPEELQALAESMGDPGEFADIIAANLSLEVADKQKVLESETANERLRLVLNLLTRHLQVLELSQKIETEVQEEVDRSQREFYLRERLRAIRRELGEDEEGGAEIDELSKRIAKAGMPEEVEKASLKELGRLGRMSPAAAEYNVSRTYLDWLLDMPWGAQTEDNLDIAGAAAILDEDHYDLDKVKKRILEYLAVRKLKPDMKGPILCFIGPPGVGKTSLGRSIARALGREFVRASLGGVHDEAEIRGHRRTYVGALPGRVIQGVKKAATMNPVFMLDEIDKIGADFRGDPSSALLEVLDPEQNHAFSDHFLEVPFDLSKVLFIATGNVPENIPDALYDRMEILELPGYTAEEKAFIARQFLIPRQLGEHGLTSEHVDILDTAVTSIVRDYTEEAGVRELERMIAAIFRAVARRVAEAMDAQNEAGPEQQVVGPGQQVVGPEQLHAYLGAVKYFSEIAEHTAQPGVATGLAWTPSGGDILFVEATRMEGKGVLTLTGQLGEIMKESAQAAMSYLRSRASELDIPTSDFVNYDVHVHVPAGAVPKDGPSAGVAMLVALASLFTGRPVHADLGLTGELTLRGMVLPVGGVKNKVLAARRAGLKRVLLPQKNEKDMEEIPAQVLEGLEFLYVTRIGEALELALQPAPRRPRKRSASKTSSASAGRKRQRRAPRSLP
jgi:ATP-dependent Lon protease